MSAEIQIEDAKNPESLSCTGSSQGNDVLFSRDGGASWVVIGKSCDVSIEWDTEESQGDRVAFSWPTDRPLTVELECTGIVNDPSVRASRSDLEAGDDAETGIVEALRRVLVVGGGHVRVSDELLRLAQQFGLIRVGLGRHTDMHICTDAFNSRVNQSLIKTGGKGKKAQRKLHRKIFGGW